MSLKTLSSAWVFILSLLMTSFLFSDIPDPDIFDGTLYESNSPSSSSEATKPHNSSVGNSKKTSSNQSEDSIVKQSSKASSASATKAISNPDKFKSAGTRQSERKLEPIPSGESYRIIKRQPPMSKASPPARDLENPILSTPEFKENKVQQIERVKNEGLDNSALIPEGL